jgi:histidinol dehydrogenase
MSASIDISSTEDRREREKGVIVYPVYSRRADGLSVGINLYPDKKHCPFNCPYCEVFPFFTNTKFSIEQMEKDLHSCILEIQKQNIPIKDICFSGNGEPALSPDFSLALQSVVNIRKKLIPSADIVLITNGLPLVQPEIFDSLKNFTLNPIALDIWLKLDAGTPEWYEKINRCTFPHEKLIEKIKAFISCAPVTIQTILCMIDGTEPPPEETLTWVNLVTELALNRKNGGIRKVQIYGKARPAPDDPKASPLPVNYLKERAALLLNSFSKNNITIPVNVY